MNAVATSQWENFAEFCRWETAVGGPDPHMALVGKMAEGLPLPEVLWRGGCYISVYNVPTAQALWENISLEEARRSLSEIEGWLRSRWAGIVTRRERRSVRRPEQLARFLHEYAHWAASVPSAAWMTTLGDAQQRYELAWEDCQRVYSLGRYVALKILEYLRRYAAAPLELPDLRPRGGWSPRHGLALLFPEAHEQLYGEDSPANLRIANGLADEARQRLDWDFGLSLDRYNVQVLLCDYKQSWTGRRQYPGRSHDSELHYFSAVSEHWNLDRAMFATRAALFPPEALGEVQGWDDVRGELGYVLGDHGYTWSDLRFDYLASRDHLEEPIPR